MITVVLFLWYNPHERRNDQYVYTCHNVNRAKRAISANLKVPHRFVVVSDRTEGFDPDIDLVPLDMSAFPHRGRYPKLMIFRHDAAELLGDRILMMDLDVCVAGDLTPLVERKEDVVFWDGNPDPRFAKKGHPLYNTSIVLLRAGSRPEVWDRFDRDMTPVLVKAEHKDGSDQVWVSKIIPGEATWSQKDGIYLAREIGATLPDNAKLVFFPGKENPSLRSTRKCYPWLTKRLGVVPA